MGKVLIATFRDDEEMNELILFLKKKGNIEILDNVPIDNVLTYDGLEVDPKYRVIRRNGTEIQLTNYEFGVLHLLARNPGQVFSRGQIYTQVWSSPYYGADDSVSSLISRIRKKIEPDPARPIYILTVWGIMFVVTEPLIFRWRYLTGNPWIHGNNLQSQQFHNQEQSVFPVQSLELSDR